VPSVNLKQQNKTRLIYFDLKSPSDSVVGMWLVSGQLADAGCPSGLQMSFTRSSVKEQRSAATKNGFTVINNEQK
jgi:hypothetical protein